MNVDTDGHMDRLTNSLRKGGMMGAGEQGVDSFV